MLSVTSDMSIPEVPPPIRNIRRAPGLCLHARRHAGLRHDKLHICYGVCTSSHSLVSHIGVADGCGMKLHIRKVSSLAAVSGLLAALALGFSAQTGGAVSEPRLQPNHVPAWWYQVPAAPEVKIDVAHLRALMDVKVDLRAQVRVADDLFASSVGKAKDETRRALAKERNRAYSSVRLADEVGRVSSATDSLETAMTAVKNEVAAWEKAEAERKAEEARKAREAAARAARSSGGAGSSASSAPAGSSGQTPRQYLDAVAARYGTSIAWSSNACGHSGSWVSGCYAGGSTVTVTTNAYSSWGRAKGEGRNVVIHESAHYLTRHKCGTVYVGGDRFENVADAYAVLLGASSGTGYGYNATDMKWAKSIAAGTCAI